MESRPASQKISLAGVLNPDENRDSAYFSSTDASSKHNSAASGMTISVLSPTSSGYHSSSADKTPSPVATGSILQTLVSPTQSNMSVASMVSPTTPGSADPRRVERPTSLENGHANGMLDPIMQSTGRRESVDSRMNQGFSDMRLGASSPYTTHNQSTSSIQNTLNQQRNPRPGLENVAIHRISNGYQPSAEREPLSKMIRTAPAITGPATSHIARAAEPTKGQAWAFPDGDEREEAARYGHSTSFLDSRRSSVTESIASSQFTTESRLPAGQRRLDENAEYNAMANTSTDFPPVHHHSLQHKQLGDLQDDDAESRAGAQPYSRTPELRKSHKLAERKRRTEMKELFDQLRDLMPQERGSKASKWEILTKAITEHQRMADAVRVMQNQNASIASENDQLRRENHALMLQHSLRHAAFRAATTAARAPRAQTAPIASRLAAIRAFSVVPPRSLFQTSIRHEEDTTPANTAGGAAAPTQRKYGPDVMLGEDGRPTQEQRAIWDNEKRRTLFVQNFVGEVTDEDLQEAFSKYGEVTKVARQKPGASFAFIEYKDAEAVQIAADNVNGTFWHGRRMVAEPRRVSELTNTKPRYEGPPTTTVFVGNISYEATDKDLNAAFGKLEDVKSIRIATDRNTGWPIGYAHADFHTVEAATKAIDVLKAQKIGNRPLRVSFASQTQDNNRRRPREGGERGQRRSREPREPREPRD
ncbi:hypothetical protein ACHAQH_000308 [Verticillium albo-atrum]